MENRHGWAALRWVVAVGVLAGSLGASAGHGARAQDGGQDELETAALAPADSLLFVSLNTDASSDQWPTAAELLDQGGLEELVYGAAARLVEESGLPAEWITPGSSFLGDEVSVALVSGGPDGFEPVVLLSSANPNQAFETAKSAFLAADGADGFAPVYSDDELTVVTDSYGQTTLARLDDLLLFGPTSAVQQAIGVAFGAEPSLADQPAFEELVEELEDERIATVWANGPALSSTQSVLYPSLVSSGLGFETIGLVSPLVGLATGVYQAVGVWAEEEGFRLDSRLTPGPRGDELTAPDDATELAERTPADALLFVDGVDLGQIDVLRSYVDAIAFGVGAEAGFDDAGDGGPVVQPTLEESYRELEELLGFDLRADLIDLLTDEYGLWVSSSSLVDADDLTAVLVSDAADPATVDASVDRLLALLRLETGDEARFNRIRIGGAAVTEILVPGGTSTGPLRLTVGVVEGQLLIGVGAGMEQYLDGPLADSLADAARFDAAFDALPDDEGGRFYLDANALVELQGAPELSGGVQEPTIAALDGLRALAAVTRMDDETQVTSVVLTVDAAAVDEEDTATPDASPGPDASPSTGGGELGVTAVTPVDAEGGRILGMSPSDGALLTLDRGGDRLCVVTSSGETEACAPYVESIDDLHVAWSPDGRRVAFTQDAARYFVDGDVLVFDRDAGELQNWTDDGYEGGIPLVGEREPGAPAPLLIDLAPAWAPDGTSVAFGRTAVGDDVGSSTTIIYRVAGPGAEPERVAPVATFPFATYFGMAYAPDGRLIYSRSAADPGDPSNGLFELAADGRSVRQVAPSSEELGPPLVLGVTSENQALVSYPVRAGQNDTDLDDELCFVALVDLATAVRTPLRLPDGGCALAAGVTGDASRVVLLSSQARPSDGSPLAVLDAARPDETPVAVPLREGVGAEGWASGYTGNDDFGLTITVDGRVLLRGASGGGLLVQLG